MKFLNISHYYMTNANGCVWSYKYCKYDVSRDYRFLTFPVKPDSNQMYEEEEGRGRVESAAQVFSGEMSFQFML